MWRIEGVGVFKTIVLCEGECVAGRILHLESVLPRERVLHRGHTDSLSFRLRVGFGLNMEFDVVVILHLYTASHNCMQLGCTKPERLRVAIYPPIITCHCHTR